MRSSPAAEPSDASSRSALRTLAILILWAGLLWVASYAALRLPVPAREGWPPDIARRAPPLARYDSGWYLKIAENGYGPPPPPGVPSEHVFFPLYPALTAALSRALHMDPFAAGLALSFAAMAAAGVLFVREGRRRLGERDSSAALLFLLLFPTSFFFLSMYAESLFLLLALLAFHAVWRGKAGSAALFGFLAGLTRLPALALSVPLALAWLARSPAAGQTRGRSDWVRAGLIGLAPAAAVCLWIFGVGLYFREPGLYFRLQESWNRGASPLAGLAQWGAALPSRIARGDARTHPVFLIDYANALVFVALGIYQALRRRWADATWTAGALLLPAATGISASVPRYLTVVYPAFYALAEIFRRRPAARWVWWIASAALLAAGLTAFVHWRWVA
ncbi:MAG: mannosyltransferase family protein [Thermoanaerobaculia bacterium]